MAFFILFSTTSVNNKYTLTIGVSNNGKIDMGIFDTITNNARNTISNAVTSGINNRVSQSMIEARSMVNQGLTNLVMSKMPKNNLIPGVVGSIVSSTTNTLVGTGINEVFSAIGVPANSRLSIINPSTWKNGNDAAAQVYTDIRNKVPQNQIIDRAIDPLSELKFQHDQLPMDAPGFFDNAESNSRYSPYAMDLFRLAPKHKFLFVCEFVFNGEYDFIGTSETRKNEFATVITNFERPKLKHHIDEVNMYNFRTTFVKKITYEPISLRFLDDRQNLSMNFFTEYLKLTHPLINVDVLGSDLYEMNGMNFDEPSLFSGSYTSLPTTDKSILREIKVYHLYDFGAKMNVYHFTNPKLVGIALDHWAMDDSEGNTIIGDFAYDGFSVELNVDIDQNQNDTISTLSNSGSYSLHPYGDSTTGYNDGTAYNTGVDQ